jgi:hypothetical protein
MDKHARQYTIRNVPASVDRALRQRAKELGLSFNRVALDALAAGAGEPLRPKRDLSEIEGSLSSRDADRLEEEIRRQHRIDPEIWK